MEDSGTLRSAIAWEMGDRVIGLENVTKNLWKFSVDFLTQNHKFNRSSLIMNLELNSQHNADNQKVRYKSK